ncbi:hypothetical protein GWK18_07300 [Kocuria sp. JC486]|uniref:hypothetical protein n=1 Tax=Kocuria TaxID=57493 RepID=UPI0013152CF9|nr:MULTISPECIES: hypothetical protein [Kocuria]NHU85398.1 hypothetical protein [Kocuria sp. JC486]
MNGFDVVTAIQMILAVAAFVGGMLLLRQAGHFRAALGDTEPRERGAEHKAMS